MNSSLPPGRADTANLLLNARFLPGELCSALPHSWLCSWISEKKRLLLAQVGTFCGLSACIFSFSVGSYRQPPAHAAETTRRP